MYNYRDYISVRSDYSSCMTLADINKNPDVWLGFYPHPTFVGILQKLLMSLDGGHKSLWITGAYGTGKSYASLVLQKLLMDDEARVRSWLSEHAKLIPDAVNKKLIECRERGVLVVYDINADGVDAKNQFIMRLQRGIIKAVQAKGGVLPLSSALDDVIERVRQDEEYFFAKRDELQDKLVYLNPGIQDCDVLEKALSTKVENSGLIHDVMTVLEARNIYLPINADMFLAWVDNVLRENNISRLVYIWDEFSSFVEHNRLELKTLEQMGEAAQQGKFYFIPVTHLNISSYVAEGSESAKKANDRFLFQQLEMPNATALKLAAHALVCHPNMEQEWQTVKEELWSGVSSLVKNYMIPQHVDIEESDFKGVLPLHPMAAYLLKNLSVTIGSNQRSMFDFLNGSDFKDFLDQGGIEVRSKQFLTLDHLWNYFMERDDLGTAPTIREIRSEFARRADSLQPETKRVFKAVLLFCLLEQIAGKNLSSLQSATVENILRSFEGDGDLSNEEVKGLIRDLEQEHCFTIVNGRCERFRDNIDNKDVEEKKKTFRESFDALALDKLDSEIASFLNVSKYGPRFKVRVSSIKTVSPSNVKERDTFSDKGNNILIHFVLAKDDEERRSISSRLHGMAKHFIGHRMMFVEIPGLSFCRDDFNAWETLVDNYARMSLADKSSKAVYQLHIDREKAEWTRKIKSSQRLTVWFPNEQGDPYSEDMSWDQLKKRLPIVCQNAFSAYTDDLCDYNITAFGKNSGLRSWALAGITFEKFSKTGAYKGVIESWKKKGISGEAAWFDTMPTHALGKLHCRCNERLNNSLKNGNSFSLRRLFIELQRPPYGLQVVPHSAFVLGFVLKSWLNNTHLQWTDGVSSRPLVDDPETLAQMIEDVLKAAENNQEIKHEKTICRLTKEEKAFIDQVSLIVGVDSPADATLEMVLRNVEERLEKIAQRVPLWVLPYYIQYEQEPRAKEMCAVIAALCEANAISSRGDTEKKSIKIREIGNLLLENDGLADELHDVMSPEYFEKAFLFYVNEAKPKLKELAERLSDDTGQYLTEIKNRFVATSSWLWKPGDTETVLEEVYRRTLCIEHVKSLDALSGYMTFDDAVTCLKEAIFRKNRIPLEYWSRRIPVFARLFEYLRRPIMSGDECIALEEVLRINLELLREIFFTNPPARQLNAMEEFFGEKWPSSATEARTLYGMFPEETASLEEESFRIMGANTIEEHGRKLLSRQLTNIWIRRTGTDTPRVWSVRNKIPAQFLIDHKDSNSIVDAILHPEGISEARLRQFVEVLNEERVIRSIDEASQCFMQWALPSRYQAMGKFSDLDLGSWLIEHLDPSPEQWLKNTRLNEAIENFIAAQYTMVLMPRARDAVKSLTEDEAKKLLLKFVEYIPDVGLHLLG